MIEKKMVLNKHKVWNLTWNQDGDVQGKEKGNGCFANLWTMYYCHVFSSQVDPEVFGGDAHTPQQVVARFNVDYL